MLLIENSDAPLTWRSVLYKRLIEQPYPLFVFEDGIIPAASMWFQMRAWIDALRSIGLQKGDHIAIALPPNRAFVAVLFAGLWEELSIALVPPSADIEAMHRVCAPRLLITTVEIADTHPAVPCSVPTTDHLPSENIEQHLQFSSVRPLTPDIRLLLRTSGTTNTPRWVALSDNNIFAVLKSHLSALDIIDRTEVENIQPARVLSLLPLFHAFGLVIDFLPAVFSGAEIIRDAENGRNTERILLLAHEHRITHCSMVPFTVQRLIQSEAGRQMLQSLQGGVIGGAPVSHEAAEFLKTTRLRVGYGQTEAAPGISLGKPGVWCAGYIGEPLGCDVQTDENAVLLFRGANTCAGYYSEQGIISAQRADGWIQTGDYVQKSDTETVPGYIFVGRTDDSFKLANGYFVEAAKVETALKTALPELREVLVYTRTGEYCDVYYAAETHIVFTEADILPTMLQCGIPSTRIGIIRRIPREHWCYTPKGSTDRNAIKKMQQ